MTWMEIAGAIVATAAALTGVGVIWRKGVVPFVKFIRRFVQAVDTTIENAEQFKPNHGTSLRDVVDRIEKRADDAAGLAEAAHAEARTLHVKVEKLDDRVGDLVAGIESIKAVAEAAIAATPAPIDITVHTEGGNA